MRVVFLCIGLFALWLVMSGVYKPLIIGLGAFSSVLCVWIIHKLGLIDRLGLFQQLGPFSSIRYLFWLTAEIGKADWAVARFILKQEMPQQQRLIRVPTHQITDVGKVLFANSITITPGTVTVETEDNSLIVHALTDDAADREALRIMGENVCRLEQAGRTGNRR